MNDAEEVAGYRHMHENCDKSPREDDKGMGVSPSKEGRCQCWGCGRWMEPSDEDVEVEPVVVRPNPVIDELEGFIADELRDVIERRDEHRLSADKSQTEGDDDGRLMHRMDSARMTGRKKQLERIQDKLDELYEAHGD